MEDAWDISDGSGVVVAVVDTGVAYENYDRYTQATDLADTTFVPGYDFANSDSHPNDDHSHGTHVAGTISQDTNNDRGVAGVAFGATIMPVKVCDSNGDCPSAAVADGITWATDNGADVINLSLGGSTPRSIYETAVNHAYNNGVVVVAASGNANGPVGYPAVYENAIAVGAVRYDETRSYYSNYGYGLDLVAPGGDTNVDQNGDGYTDGVLQQTIIFNFFNPSEFDYVRLQGTSMAAPHVAGVAALLIAQGTYTTPDQVRQVLQSTAKDLGAVGCDLEYGYGLVQAADALNYSPSSTPTPCITATPTATPTITPTPTPTATPTPAPYSSYLPIITKGYSP
jgi:serine protease